MRVARSQFPSPSLRSVERRTPSEPPRRTAVRRWRCIGSRMASWSAVARAGPQPSALSAWRPRASHARGPACRVRDAADDNAPYPGLALYPSMPSVCCRVSVGATGAELGPAALGPRCPRTRTNCSRSDSFFASPLSLRCPGHRCALVSHAGASRSSLTQAATCSRGGGPSLSPGVARRACGAGAAVREQLGLKAPECNHAPRPELGPDCGAGGTVCE